jgi:hypothetical protein
MVQAREMAELQELANRANGTDRNNRMVQIMAGWGVSEENIKKALAQLNSGSPAAGSVLDASYAVRGALGKAGLVKNSAEGQRLFNEVNAELSEIAKGRSLTQSDVMDALARRGVTNIDYNTAVGAGNALRGGDAQWQYAAENLARIAADHAAAQKYLDSRPWYEFAHKKDFLTKLTMQNRGEMPGIVDVIKNVLNPSEQMRTNIGAFYSAILNDIGIDATPDQIKSGFETLFTVGQFGLDTENSGKSIDALQNGAYVKGAGYASLAMAGIILNKAKAVGGVVVEGFGLGFSSFRQLKNFLGANQAGHVYHHIVEQHADNIAQFGRELIQNTGNIIELPHGAGTIHNMISGHYSSIRPFTDGLTVRQWLKTQSFEQQYQYGIDLIKRLGGENYLR